MYWLSNLNKDSAFYFVSIDFAEKNSDVISDRSIPKYLLCSAKMDILSLNNRY